MYGTEKDPGIVPNCIEFLINEKQKSNIKIQCSVFEIYNETINDLLTNQNESNKKKIAICSQKIITGAQEERVTNMTQMCIDSVEQFKGLLATANKRRKVATTQRNIHSSRSHAIVQLQVSGSWNNRNFESILVLLDLAGMESSADHLTENNSTIRAEMTNINTSLCAFGTAIDGLKRSKTADFRSSKLTHFLKPFLTQNSKTVLIATAAQEQKYLSSSNFSLSTGSAARQIPIKNVKRNIVEK